MIETRINYIDRKETAIVSAQFEDVTRATGIDEFGESYEYTSSCTLIAIREYEFSLNLTDNDIWNYIDNERKLF